MSKKQLYKFSFVFYIFFHSPPASEAATNLLKQSSLRMTFSNLRTCPSVVEISMPFACHTSISYCLVFLTPTISSNAHSTKTLPPVMRDVWNTKPLPRRLMRPGIVPLYIQPNAILERKPNRSTYA